MKKSQLEKVVRSGVDFLSEFFPKESALYFPLLSATIVWALRRVRDWKEKVLSWKIWIDPGYIEAKPDEFVLEFFKNHPSLSQSFEQEIQKREMETLREAFSCLYPILGLEDPFLTALFAQELDCGDYRKIVRDFPQRVRQARENIEATEEEHLLEGLKSIGEEAASLQLEILSQTKLRRLIAAIVKENLKKG